MEKLHERYGPLLEAVEDLYKLDDAVDEVLAGYKQRFVKLSSKKEFLEKIGDIRAFVRETLEPYFLEIERSFGGVSTGLVPTSPRQLDISGSSSSIDFDETPSFMKNLAESNDIDTISLEFYPYSQSSGTNVICTDPNNKLPLLQLLGKYLEEKDL